ncbi:MAG: cellulase family glycosylhydrolase [Phycisphaerae bacterium]|nr:cellulase family glycosylhydrolase [Phycisphaerae bacterium]
MKNIFVLGALLLILQCGKISAANTDSNSVRLRIQGTKFFDGNGNKIKLHGIYSREEWLQSEQEVIHFKEWGINFVRFLLAFDRDYWKTVNNGKVDLKKRCILRDENIQKTKTKCQWLEKHKIYFIIEVPWKWYGIDQELEKPELLKEQCARMYKTLAENFAGFEYLAGFCMFSEIYIVPEDYKHYKDICTAIVDAVHEVDPGLIVSATGVRVSGPDSLVDETLIERPNVIYDFHYYDIKTFVAYRPWFGDMRYPGRIPHGYSCRSYYLDKELHETFIAPAISFSKRYNVPVWCGEFGAFNNAPDGSSDRWMRDVCRIFERNDIPWIIWTWKKDMNDVPASWKDLWQGKLDYNEVTINPHGGRFTDELPVQIDSWVRDGEIYYTLDGTEPDKHSKLYEGPFSINKTTTVKAVLIRKDMGRCPVDTTVFEFGGLKPPVMSAKVSAGLRYAVYNTAGEKVEELKYDKAEKIGISRGVGDIHLKKSDGKTIVYDGLIDISKAGRYFFYPISYGAYEIYIDDTLVNKHFAVKLDYARTTPGIITLEAGLHRLKIIYSKPEGLENGFELKLQRDAVSVEPPCRVEEEMLFHTDNP